ncbi:hypothetical protein NNC19_13710 [Clostridium sp. SHJSY1]|uniref:hypothetical protein n=1 Tax=Clostridium sp. SHJSY1 TaxID=2942483 RepID=UPI002874A035|nr:hypothetical protein [Clostridium sp. SHJSY1]MDS0526743.1 hypothetical protein [Clostridium sp. SHJSY1]
MKCKVAIEVIAVMSTIFLISCSSKSTGSFSKEVAPYTKEDSSEYTYKFNRENIVMNNSCSNLKIVKSDSDEIKVSIKKLVGGDKEENLQEALDNIKCSLEDNILKIGPETDDKELINSKNIETTLSIPQSITSLDIKSNVGDINLEGDYSNLRVNEEVGRLSYTGNLQQASISANVGDINLNLQQLDASNKYDINGRAGDVNIKIPKDSSINLTGSSVKDIKLGKEINSSSEGSTFEINRTVSDIKIDN